MTQTIKRLDTELRVAPPSFRAAGPAGALLIGGDRTALGIARSLGRQGIAVWVLADGPAVATVSRYAQRTLAWPATAAEQLACLISLAEQHGLYGWALFAHSDISSALIAQHHEQLSEYYRLTTPPWEVLRWAYDKRLTYRIADDLGIGYPWTYYPGSARDLVTLERSFPLILKPAIKQGYNQFTSAKAWRADNRQELVMRYTEACALVDPELVMVQDLIPGGGEVQFSYVALCCDGQPLASALARRARQYPIDFGHASTFVETIELPAIEAPARLLLRALRYTGLVELEFKLDARDGEYKLLDFNPRAWAWHSLCRAAGVDFPFLYWQLLHGEQLPELRAQPGVRWMHLSKDLLAVWQELRRGRLRMGEYLGGFGTGLEWALFASDDPTPSLVELPLALRTAWKRRNGTWH